MPGLNSRSASAKAENSRSESDRSTSRMFPDHAAFPARSQRARRRLRPMADLDDPRPSDPFGNSIGECPMSSLRRCLTDLSREMVDARPRFLRGLGVHDLDLLGLFL